jgi:hypothetical protein
MRALGRRGGGDAAAAEPAAAETVGSPARREAVEVRTSLRPALAHD